MWRPRRASAPARASHASLTTSTNASSTSSAPPTWPKSSEASWPSVRASSPVDVSPHARQISHRPLTRRPRWRVRARPRPPRNPTPPVPQTSSSTLTARTTPPRSPASPTTCAWSCRASTRRSPCSPHAHSVRGAPAPPPPPAAGPCSRQRPLIPPACCTTLFSSRSPQVVWRWPAARSRPTWSTLRSSAPWSGCKARSSQPHRRHEARVPALTSTVARPG